MNKHCSDYEDVSSNEEPKKEDEKPNIIGVVLPSMLGGGKKHKGREDFLQKYMLDEIKSQVKQMKQLIIQEK